ncbi:MAG: PAS domain-containing protein [Pseudomonadota bacterium]
MDEKIVMIGKDFGRWMTTDSAVADAGAQPWREVRAYWEGLRKDGGIPARDAIDPRGIAGALEQVFMIERIAPGLARFRLVGSKITELVGCDMRGMPFTALFDPDGRRKSGPLLEGVFAGPAILHVDLEAERGIGKPALRAHLMLLPLLSHGDKTDLALGCLALDGPIGRAPRRFAVARSQLESLSAVSAGTRSAETAFAEPAPAFVVPRPPRSEGRHLRLVQSSD